MGLHSGKRELTLTVVFQPPLASHNMYTRVHAQACVCARTLTHMHALNKKYIKIKMIVVAMS